MGELLHMPERSGELVVIGVSILYQLVVGLTFTHLPVAPSRYHIFYLITVSL